MTKVVHCRKQPYDVYIGRANSHCGLLQSKWANPFVIGVDGDRKEVLEKFESYLIGNKELMVSLHELEGLTLGCWCHPKACHGEILIKHLKASKFITY